MINKKGITVKQLILMIIAVAVLMFVYLAITGQGRAILEDIGILRPTYNTSRPALQDIEIIRYDIRTDTVQFRDLNAFYDIQDGQELNGKKLNKENLERRFTDYYFPSTLRDESLRRVQTPDESATIFMSGIIQVPQEREGTLTEMNIEIVTGATLYPFERGDTFIHIEPNDPTTITNRITTRTLSDGTEEILLNEEQPSEKIIITPNNRIFLRDSTYVEGTGGYQKVGDEFYTVIGRLQSNSEGKTIIIDNAPIPDSSQTRAIYEGVRPILENIQGKSYSDLTDEGINYQTLSQEYLFTRLILKDPSKRLNIHEIDVPEEEVIKRKINQLQPIKESIISAAIAWRDSVTKNPISLTYELEDQGAVTNSYCVSKIDQYLVVDLGEPTTSPTC